MSLLRSGNDRRWTLIGSQYVALASSAASIGNGSQNTKAAGADCLKVTIMVTMFTIVTT
jgi:hypothetical protein